MTHDEVFLKWLSIWYSFVADLLDEWGYPEIRTRTNLGGIPGEQVLIAFFDKLDMLSRAIPLMLSFSRVLSSGAKPDPDDIQEVGRILEEFGPSPAVEGLKSNIREFLK